MAAVACVGCGAVFEDREGPTHRYLESSPGCWASYGEVLAREYSDFPAYGALHRLTVDTYAVQHPGRPSPQCIQSVALHLMSLCLVLEREIEPRRATEFLQTVGPAQGTFHLAHATGIARLGHRQGRPSCRKRSGAREARTGVGGIRVDFLVVASRYDSRLAPRRRRVALE